MVEIWLNHLSVHPWQDADAWKAYFDEAERILGVRITHLDVSDPVRRQYLSSADSGTYICAFGDKEDSRQLFGKCSNGVEFGIWHFRHLDQWCNSFHWYVPEAFIARPENCERLKRLFDFGNAALKPFYAYADALPHITQKKKKSGFAVDIRKELLGVFWLTYFCKEYVQFFGPDKFSTNSVEISSAGGATVQLSAGPDAVPKNVREQWTAKLGRQCFVDPDDKERKLPGQFVLSFEQLMPK